MGWTLVTRGCRNREGEVSEHAELPPLYESLGDLTWACKESQRILTESEAWDRHIDVVEGLLGPPAVIFLIGVGSPSVYKDSLLQTAYALSLSHKYCCSRLIVVEPRLSALDREFFEQAGAMVVRPPFMSDAAEGSSASLDLSYLKEQGSQFVVAIHTPRKITEALYEYVLSRDQSQQVILLANDPSMSKERNQWTLLDRIPFEVTERVQDAFHGQTLLFKQPK